MRLAMLQTRAWRLKTHKRDPGPTCAHRRHPMAPGPGVQARVGRVVVHVHAVAVRRGRHHQHLRRPRWRRVGRQPYQGAPPDMLPLSHLTSAGSAARRTRPC